MRRAFAVVVGGLMASAQAAPPACASGAHLVGGIPYYCGSPAAFARCADASGVGCFGLEGFAPGPERPGTPLHPDAEGFDARLEPADVPLRDEACDVAHRAPAPLANSWAFDARGVGPRLVMLATGEAPVADEPRAEAEPEQRVWPAFVLGTLGAALAGGYVAGAYLTGDRPSGVTLGVTGGVVTGGLLGAGLALGIGALRKDPGSLVRYILVPVLSGLAGAALGGLGAGLGARVPGTGRTVTHVVVVSLLLAETITLIIAR